MKTSLEDYSNNCRTCLIELDDSKIHIHETENIPRMLSQCTPLSIRATDGLMQYICQPCSQQLQNAFNFRKKCETVDNFLKGLIVPSSPDCDANSVPTSIEAKQFVCDLCSKTFTRNTSLQIHLERHKKVRAHKCTLCTKAFKTQQDLKVHQSRHAKASLFQCHTCSRNFFSKNAMVKHMKIHSSRKTHLCSYCGKEFYVLDTLKTHLKIHTKENLLSCPICDLKFAARASLQLHLKKHTGETPHLCSVCGSRFKAISELKRHEVRHTGAKNHKCEVCDKKFTTAHARKVHEEGHAKLRKCDFCDKKSQSGLSRHSLQHTSRMFQCSECSCSFHTRKDLEVHNVLHSGNLPFVCTCGKGFNRKNNYTRHLKVHQIKNLLIN